MDKFIIIFICILILILYLFYYKNYKNNMILEEKESFDPNKNTPNFVKSYLNQQV